MASHAAKQVVWASVEEREIVGYFLLDQEMGPDPSKNMYPDVDKRYSYHTMTKAGDPDAPNPVQFKDARYLVEKSGRLIYNITDDGVVRKIYDLAEE